MTLLLPGLGRAGVLVLGAFISVGLLAVFSPSAAQRHSAAPKTPAAVVFDVQQNAGTIMVSPVLLFHDGSFDRPFSVLGGDKARRRFVEEYFIAGKTYFLIFGGGDAGTLRIKSGYWEDGSYAYGELEEKAEFKDRIHRQVHGLATDFVNWSRRGGFRRAPTDEERAAAVELAKTAFLEQRVPANSLPKMEVTNLTAIDVDGDNKAELVGSFKVPTREMKPPHFLFLIADGEGQHYRTVRANYQFNPDQTQYPLGLEMFIDSLDIDGDGTNEIVTSFTTRDYFDIFEVYQRKNGKWNQVFAGGGAHPR